MAEQRWPVIYLTGAPAAGKTSLSSGLKERVPTLEIFEYGARLTAHVQGRLGRSLEQSDLRRRSAGVVRPEDVAEVDRLLIDFVDEHRGHSPVLIDSHAVTREEYGFRVTPYSLRDFERLGPTQIWVLYTSPDIALQRIGAAPAGRRPVSYWEAGFHAALQSSVAATYAMQLGVPLQVIDGTYAGVLERCERWINPPAQQIEQVTVEA